MNIPNILIDTNILLDCALKRNGNHENASKIIYCCLTGKINGFMTSHSLCDFFYITRKEFSIEKRQKILMVIADRMKILGETNQSFKNVLTSSTFFDIEDGLQIECAAEANLDFIITENLKDFETSEVPAISAADFVQRF